MIAYLEGRVLERQEGEAVILAGGVGFRVLMSSGALAALPRGGETAGVYTHLVVREDAFELYGFSGKEEREMFLLLTGVSGVGPRTALAVLSALPLRDLKLAIAMEDFAALARAPGIGKKTAQRIALELKDKVGAMGFGGASGAETGGGAPVEVGAADAMGEALLALQSLGYTRQEAASALQSVKDKADTADELVRQALRAMAFAK